MVHESVITTVDIPADSHDNDKKKDLFEGIRRASIGRNCSDGIMIVSQAELKAGKRAGLAEAAAAAQKALNRGGMPVVVPGKKKETESKTDNLEKSSSTFSSGGGGSSGGSGAGSGEGEVAKQAEAGAVVSGGGVRRTLMVPTLRYNIEVC